MTSSVRCDNNIYAKPLVFVNYTTEWQRYHLNAQLMIHKPTNIYFIHFHSFHLQQLKHTHTRTVQYPASLQKKSSSKETRPRRVFANAQCKDMIPTSPTCLRAHNTRLHRHHSRERSVVFVEDSFAQQPLALQQTHHVIPEHLRVESPHPQFRDEQE
jgi:hypothetical protein